MKNKNFRNENNNMVEKKKKNLPILITILAILSVSGCCCGSIGIFLHGDNDEESSSKNTSELTTEKTTNTPIEKLEDKKIGESVTINDVTVTVNSVTDVKTSTGSDAYEVNITYKNNSGELLTITPYDWTTVLHTGSDKAHVGGDVSFHLDNLSDGEEWTGIVTLWKDDNTEKIKFESSDLNLLQDNKTYATWLLNIEPETTITEEETKVTTETATEITTTLATTTKVTEPPTEPVPHREGMSGISDKRFTSDMQILFENSVRNDKTGKWKLAKTSTSLDITEYALDYYNEYFESDNEIHAFVNFSNNTTARISIVAGMIDVTIHEYVEKEEHDADLLFSGMVLDEYFVYIDNGDIEKVQ